MKKYFDIFKYLQISSRPTLVSADVNNTSEFLMFAFFIATLKESMTELDTLPAPAPAFLSDFVNTQSRPSQRNLFHSLCVHRLR